MARGSTTGCHPGGRADLRPDGGVQRDAPAGDRRRRRRGAAGTHHRSARHSRRRGRGGRGPAVRHRRLAAVPARATGPDRGVRHHEQRPARGAGRAAGLDAGGDVPRPGLPVRRVRRRRRAPRVGLAAAPGPQAARGTLRRRRPADRRRAVAHEHRRGHPRVVARALRVQAGRLDRLAGARAVRRELTVRGRPDGRRVPGDDLAGLQRLGRLLALRGRRRRPAQLGGELRPPVPRARRHRDAVRRRARRGGRGADRDPAGVSHQHRPGPAAGRSRGRDGLRVDRARRVLDRWHALAGRDGAHGGHQPRLPRREHDVLAGPARGRRPGRRRLPVRRLARPRSPRASAPGSGATRRARSRRTS